jgi:hypothetical protein
LLHLGHAGEAVSCAHEWVRKEYKGGDYLICRLCRHLPDFERTMQRAENAEAKLGVVMAYATALRNALEAAIIKPSALPDLMFAVGRALDAVDALVPRPTSATPPVKP